MCTKAFKYKIKYEIHSFNVARNTFIIFVGLEAATMSEDRNRLNNEQSLQRKMYWSHKLPIISILNKMVAECFVIGQSCENQCQGEIKVKNIGISNLKA